MLIIYFTRSSFSHIQYCILDKQRSVLCYNIFFYINNTFDQDAHPGCTQCKFKTYYSKYYIQKF